jgi:hypothetical protein
VGPSFWACSVVFAAIPHLGRHCQPAFLCLDEEKIHASGKLDQSLKDKLAVHRMTDSIDIHRVLLEMTWK